MEGFTMGFLEIAGSLCMLQWYSITKIQIQKQEIIIKPGNFFPLFCYGNIF